MSNAPALSKPPNPALKTSRFLAACRREPVDATPIWLMRQAGRYMANYRALRARHSMLEAIHTPELAAEITMQPIEAFDLDAAIIFSDILPPLKGMGLGLDYVKGVGPRLDNPIRTVADIEALATPPMAEVMGGTLAAIGMVKQALVPHGIPLIGFAGAPFTLASYAIEGGGSKSYAKTKALMYSNPEAWDTLMQRLTTVIADYLARQAEAGADALQVFDSWAGAVGQLDYERFIQPYTRRVIAAAQQTGVPVINFSTGTAGHLHAVAAAGGDVVGVDFRLPLDAAWQQIGTDRPIMGNLDPVTLHASWEVVQRRTDDVLARAAGRPGHIFNLGHGILPETPVDNVRRLVDYVHQQTTQA